MYYFDHQIQFTSVDSITIACGRIPEYNPCTDSVSTQQPVSKNTKLHIYLRTHNDDGSKLILYFHVVRESGIRGN